MDVLSILPPQYVSLLITDQRSIGVKIYVGVNEAISPESEDTMKFDNNQLWREIKHFEKGFGYVGIAHLDSPEKARYVAAVRIAGKDNSINLKEVQIYHRPSE